MPAVTPAAAIAVTSCLRFINNSIIPDPVYDQKLLFAFQLSTVFDL